jgi:pyruvate formate lyase activating enzyme
VDEVRGSIFSIQRFSIHDGPGIRTTVFLKGCPLRCFWCHNPEGLEREFGVQYFSNLCIGCGECARECPTGAHALVDGLHVFSREGCTGCDGTRSRCVEACPSKALVLTGRLVEVEEVVAEVLRDSPFYASSGGGVTLSGGEPLYQRDFAAALLSRCMEEGVHTAIETAGAYPWSWLEGILPFVNLVMMDIKHLDGAKHLKATGMDNGAILENARRLSHTGLPLILRVPVIPGVNDTPGEVSAIRDYVRLLRDEQPAGSSLSFELLAYHPLALDKYRSLGRENPCERLAPLSGDRMLELEAIAQLDQD